MWQVWERKNGRSGDGHGMEVGVGKDGWKSRRDLGRWWEPQGAGYEAWREENCALDETSICGMNTSYQASCEESPDEEFLDGAQRILDCLRRKPVKLLTINSFAFWLARKLYSHTLYMSWCLDPVFNLLGSWKLGEHLLEGKYLQSPLGNPETLWEGGSEGYGA